MTKTSKRKKTTTTAHDPRWARVVVRDRLADGHFWFSVATTRIYCRPSCPARTANPENVVLHETLESAQATGFRPCKRCKPDGASQDAQNAALVANACRLIERSEAPPSLTELAGAVGLSASYFHRMFKASTGLTPKEYIVAHRAGRVRSELPKSQSITTAMYDAGFNSSGRFFTKRRPICSA